MTKGFFEKDELYDSMLFSPLFWFDQDGAVVAAFAEIDDAWRWACMHPEQIVHPYYFGSSLSGNNGRVCSEVTKLGLPWFAGWCKGKAIALVR